MATLLDYYNQNPELWEENKHLLAKDPAFDLGMMDLGVVNFEEREGGDYTPQYGPIGKKLQDWIGLGDKPEYQPKSRVLGSHNPYDKEIRDLPGGAINLYTGPFTKGDTPTYWTDPNLVPPDERTSEPLFNVDKARVIAHENRHKLTNENPELYDLQPTWSGIEEGMSRNPDDLRYIMGNKFWRDEAFNRFMDYRNFPNVQFRGIGSEWYPSGMSSPNLKPTDMYFDKIWKDHWEKNAQAYDKKAEEISKRQRKNVPGTPIVPMGGGDKGGGYQPTTRAQNVARTSSRVGPGGNVKAYGLAHGGLMDIPLPGRSRDI